MQRRKQNMATHGASKNNRNMRTPQNKLTVKLNIQQQAPTDTHTARIGHKEMPYLATYGPTSEAPTWLNTLE